MRAAHAVGGRAGQRKGTRMLTFSLFSLSNPAPVDFRCSEEDEGRVRRRERERKNIDASRAPTPLNKPLGT